MLQNLTISQHLRRCSVLKLETLIICCSFCVCQKCWNTGFCYEQYCTVVQSHELWPLNAHGSSTLGLFNSKKCIRLKIFIVNETIQCLAHLNDCRRSVREYILHWMNRCALNICMMIRCELKTMYITVAEPNYRSVSKIGNPFKTEMFWRREFSFFMYQVGIVDYYFITF
jgi:hypothetical protein